MILYNILITHCIKYEKVSSSLLERGSVPAWHDLPSRLRLRFVTRLLETLETFSLVLPRTISSPDREVSVSSNNLCEFYFYIYFYILLTNVHSINCLHLIFTE